MTVNYTSSIIASISILVPIFISLRCLFSSQIIKLILSSTKFPKDDLKISYLNLPIACHTLISNYLCHLNFTFSIDHSIVGIMLI